MDWITILITPLMGAVIGYFTNWIAIKMLFRPYGEKHLFGIKLPFTPGLIPNERAALAKKVGETTATHVLTDEVLSAALLTPELNEKLAAVVGDVFSSLRQNERTVGDCLMLLNIGPTESGASADAYLTGFLQEQLQKDSVKKAVSDYITDCVLNFLSAPGSVIDTEKLLDAAKTLIGQKGKELMRSEEFADKIKNCAAAGVQKLAESEAVFSDVIPEKMVLGLQAFVKARLLTAGGDIEKLFGENPALEEKLRQMVHDMAEENFGKLLGIFVNYDKIYANLKKNLITYLSDAQNQEFLILKLSAGVGKLMASDLKSILARMPEGFDQDVAEKIAAFIQSPDRDAEITKILSFLQNKLPQAGEIDLLALIQKIEPDFRKKLSAAIAPIVEQRVLPGASALAAAKLPQLRQQLAAVQIRALLGGLSAENEASLKALAHTAIKAALENGGGYVIKNIDMGKIIEDKINGFEVDEAEKIIVSVVNRELNAITWLGGLLGLILGFVPVITSFLGG
ncbi:MAG: DUF445 domain-containing protein [Clostridiales bacterium]|jgi:uncharacterized membrane protein YheB (UPF0754 family)|nr:DUF445 domain-containing protein [Clostridiales bacterium]